MVIPEIDNLLLRHSRQTPPLEILAVLQILLPRRRSRATVQHLLVAGLFERGRRGGSVRIDDGAVLGVAARVFAFEAKVEDDGADKGHLWKEVSDTVAAVGRSELAKQNAIVTPWACL